MTIDQLLTEYKISELYRGGFLLEEFYQNGYTLATLYQAFIDDNGSWDFLVWFTSQGVTIDDLIAIGADIQDLYSHFATIEQLIDSSIPLKDLVVSFNGQVSSIHFLNHGVPFQELMDEGIIEETPTPGLYVMNYLFEYTGHNHSWGINRLNDEYAPSNAQWFIPTQEQLLMVFDNQDQMDPKFELFGGKLRISSTQTTTGICDVTPLRRSVSMETGGIVYCMYGGIDYAILPMIQL